MILKYRADAGLWNLGREKEDDKEELAEQTSAAVTKPSKSASCTIIGEVCVATRKL